MSGIYLTHDGPRRIRTRMTNSQPSPTAVVESLRYLASVGVDVVAAPAKFKRRGFDFCAPNVGQMLSRSDVVTFADNERDLRS